MGWQQLLQGPEGKEDSTLQIAQTQPVSHFQVFYPCQAQTNKSVWRKMCPIALVARLKAPEKGQELIFLEPSQDSEEARSLRL